MPDVHALLSASSSKQWLNCPPSARLQEQFPNESSVYAEEGTYAHSVCEYKIKKYLHERVKRPQSEEFYSEELEQSTDVYYEFVVSIIEEMKRNGCEPLVMVEERVDYSHIAPSGFGTADMVIIGHDAEGKGILHICDYKNGKGVFVDYNHNTQMMLYALGALNAYGYIYPIEIVRMSIIQPRLENVGTCEMPVEELVEWGESIKENKEKAVDDKNRDIYFDSDCIKLLNDHWHIDKKKIYLVHPNMYFENRELTPLLDAEKKKQNGAEWKQAYNAFKHSRNEEIEKANIWNMLNALGALYILNLYYADESFWFETPMEKKHEYRNFSEVFEPALCDTTKIGIGAEINPDVVLGLTDPTFEESIFILKYTDKTFLNMQEVVGNFINTANSELSGYQGSVDSFMQEIHNHVLPQYAKRLTEAQKELRNKEVILNKNSLRIFGLPQE